ncbi:MAG TPA: DegQ family serine endoprotease [Blastocatellia bacterium]|nr:DegQ family serine endoprotease [Blastocatellia bacterium]
MQTRENWLSALFNDIIDSVVNGSRARRRSTLIIGALALIILVGTPAAAVLTVKANRTTRASEPAVTARPAPPGDAAALRTSFAPIVKDTLPAIVTISSSRVVRTSGESPFLNDPFFRRFFGGQMPEQPDRHREHGLGSGVVINPEGYILTNNHVVDGATDVTVSLADKREFKARIVGTDAKTDIAVLKISTTGLQTVPLGDSSSVQVGDLVLAIGNPFGLGQTVTMGIVSAKGRGNLGIEDYEDFIQTDAAINPGNSGGALVDSRGYLIGINTAILSNGIEGNQGVGFAVPIDLARHVMDQILKTGKVVRGYIGVSIQEITPAIARSFNLSQSSGALVADVVPDGPAARSGIERGDVVTMLNGDPVPGSRELRLRISQMAPGATARLRIYRNGSERDVNVTLGQLPEDKKTSQRESDPDGAMDGIQIEELTPAIARQLGLRPGIQGVALTAVEEGSAAYEAGLREGDVVQEVNRKPITSVLQFKQAIRQARGSSIVLLVNRGGNTSYVPIEPR